MNSLKKLFFLGGVSLLGLMSVSYAVAQSGNREEVSQSYRQYKEVINPPIAVPTVVEVPFGAEFIERFDFAVFDVTVNSYEPYFFRRETIVDKIPISAAAAGALGGAQRMIDDNVRTYSEFSVPESAQGRTEITLSGQRPITSSAITVLLDNYVALPTYVELRAVTNQGPKIVIANRKMTETTIRFPETTAVSWTLVFTYGQPLRITELKLVQENAAKKDANALRFLAQPNHSYRVYFDPDRHAEFAVGEAGNLSSDKDVLKLSPAPSLRNPAYVIADVDKDNVPDVNDNCVSIPNPDQLDVNSNGRGDLCDDFDKDGIINSKDNCPDQPNRDQKDTDGDKKGDVCDKEESRITEKYKWIPWVGIGFAALVLIVLFAVTARSLGKGNSTDDKQSS